jgi:hypothetical protein
MTPTAPLAKPRRQIGPDVILMLRNFSLQHTGDRFAYDACRVQRNPFGGPMIEIDFANMETLTEDHPEAYGTFISRRIMPKAKLLAAHIAKQDISLRHWELQTLLKKARRQDSEAYWLLSAAPLRSLLFPNGYNKAGLRADRIVYRDHAGDWQNRGKAVYLEELTRASAQRFVDYANRITVGTLDPITITPLYLQRT